MHCFRNVLMGFCILGIFTLTNAHASFLIEPHLGYNISGGTASYLGSKYDYSGAQVGARLGMQSFGLMGGLDYTHAGFDLKQTNLTSQASATTPATQEEIGVFLGYNAPLLLRAWLGYYFSTKMTFSNTITSYFKGTTTEIGVGFTPLPLISLNVVYRMVSFDKGHTAAAGDYTIAYAPKEIVLGVSVPFNLL